MSDAGFYSLQQASYTRKQKQKGLKQFPRLRFLW